MDKKELALGKSNLILIAIGFLIIIIGFLLMTGSGTEQEFNPDIFSTRRIVIAPTVSLFGFIFIIYGIVRKSK
ncbi:MAG TPA: DUF3098 domain-containing protein [Bacteroidales bacterium]